MKICHIISGDLWAGAEVMACHLLLELRTRDNVHIYVLVLNHGRLAEELISAGLDVTVIDEKEHSFLSLMLSVKKYLFNIYPDIIHAHRYKENFLAYFCSLMLNNVRLVSTLHGLSESLNKDCFFCKIKNYLNLFILKNLFDKTIAVSNDIKKIFEYRYCFSKDKLTYIRNGIPCVEVPMKIRNEMFVVGSSGRLFPVKDYTLMVEIALNLKEYNIQFVLAGEGPERKKIETLINSYGLQDSFRLLGHLDDMSLFYQGIHLYLNTSIHEGIPMTILEAMVHGLPIVAPKVGGIPEVVGNNEEGFLVASRDPNAFAEKCLILYKNHKLWAQMSQAAKSKAINEFSVQSMANKYIDVYNSINSVNL